MNKEKIGVGITTCNRVDYFNQCYNSIDLSKIDHLVVVNDGFPINFEIEQSDKVHFIQNEENIGVGRTKNKIFKYLLEKECDHIFTLEDDCIIADNTVFEEYIKASKITGLKHFNFGPGSPWNRVQLDPSIIGDLSKRGLATQNGDPNPKIIIDYKKHGVSISLYEHIVAMFCYFDAKALKDVGLIDERFYNAWEHVEHTLRFIKKRYYTPFWWFADITGSDKYIKEAKDEKSNTSLAKNENQFMKQVQEGLKIFYDLHQTIPSQIPPAPVDYIKPLLKEIYEYNKNN
jgi:GT2 family glycosyltransferase